MDIRIVRLLSGEDLLCELVPQGPTLVAGIGPIISVKNPVRVVLIPNKVDPSSPKVGLAPWCDFVDDKVFELQQSHILFIARPIREFEDQYNQLFGSILTPTKGLILPS